MNKISLKNSADIYMWTDGLSVEPQAMQQLYNVAKLPFIYRHIAIMPDVHAGIGATIGSVIPTKGAVIPSAAGVDLGCGMLAVKTTLTKENLPVEKLPALRKEIERLVPTGRTNNGGEGDKGAWSKIPKRVYTIWDKYLKDDLKAILRKHKKIKTKHLNDVNHLGTLGGGNHFIEVCLDEDDNVWLMLHSGSRGVGNRIGQYFINLAKTVCLEGKQEDMKAIDDKYNAYFKSDSFQSLGGKQKKAKVDEMKRLTKEEKDKLGVKLPNSDLAYFEEGTQYFRDYMEAVQWAQDYAYHNRELMLEQVIQALENIAGSFKTEERTNCFAGETRIITKYGTCEIRNLCGGNHEILTTDGIWVKSPVKSFGKQRLYRLTIGRCGIEKDIYTTAEHGWIIDPVQRTFEVEKTTLELKKGDRIKGSFSKRVVDKLSEEGVARGFVFGDGSHTSKNKSCAIFCGNKDESVMDVFVRNGFGRNPRIYDSYKRINGLPAEWKLEIPQPYEDDEYLYGWIAGYFAADGDVDKSGRPTLSSSSYSNLNLVRDLATKIGVGTYGIRKHMRKGFGEEDTAIYMLGFMRKSLSSEFFLVDSHRERFNQCDISERNRWRVVSIEETDRYEEVYCAVVDEYHAFTLEDNILTRNCHHNYVAEEEHFGERVLITRKGAIRAGLGGLAIIPGSMGAKSYIVRGLGNEDSFCSASHGAGRKMSRSAAKKAFTVEDHKKATEGVECCKDESVLDETPLAYKDIDAVMEAEKDLVEPVYQLKQIICIKG